MVGGDNADSKYGLVAAAAASSASSIYFARKKMEGEDSVRTVECLRGRLLAERVASRNAKEAAEIWENKLIDLENMLKQETKSRNRAEKKLRLLTKKLESLNTSQVSDEPSEQSSLDDKSDVSSLTSTSNHDVPTTDEVLKESCTNDSEMGENSENGFRDQYTHSDNSMAIIVPVYMAKETEKTDPQVLDTNVKEVLDTLKRAKESLQSSMSRRSVNNMVTVG